MKIGFLSLPVSGHPHPMTALARRLQSRGNEVVFVGVPDTEACVCAADLAFLPYGEDQYPPGSIARIIAPVARMSGLDVLKYTLEAISPGLLETALRDLPGKLAETGVQGLVIDNTYFFAELVPMSLDLPFVQIWPVLPSHPSGAAPPLFAGWPHDTTPETLARNAEGMTQFRGFLAPMMPIAQGLRRQCGPGHRLGGPRRDELQAGRDARRRPGSSTTRTSPGPTSSTTRARSMTTEAGSRCRSPGRSWTAGRSSMLRWGRSSTVEIPFIERSSERWGDFKRFRSCSRSARARASTTSARSRRTRSSSRSPRRSRCSSGRRSASPMPG